LPPTTFPGSNTNARSLNKTTAGRDLQGALDKFEAVLSPAMKKFLDRLPRVISAKALHAKRQDKETYQTTARLLEASGSCAGRAVSDRLCTGSPAVCRRRQCACHRQRHSAPVAFSVQSAGDRVNVRQDAAREIRAGAV
jgi:hypothetical protein